MSFDWSQYFNLAKELGGEPGIPATEEARLRSAISRAYYAVFIQARNYMLFHDNHIIPANVNPHGYVQVQFVTSSNRLRREIGKRLYSLRQARNRADYADNFNNLITTTRKSLRAAEEILTYLSRL